MGAHAVGVGDDRRERHDLARVGLDAADTRPVRPSGSARRRVAVRNSTPSSSASFTSASGTARVPPRGYQMPSCVCMWAMPQSTAGEARGTSRRTA